MAFCNKCGNEIKEGALFCNKCGSPVEPADLGPQMSTDESIAYLDKLKSRLTEIEKLEHEVSDNEERLNKPIQLNYGSYSFFRFYWPYLVGAGVTFIVLSFITLIVASGGSDTASIIFLILTYGSPIAILIAGIFLASKKRGEENYAVSLGNEKAKQQRTKLEKDTAELKSKLATRKRDLASFNTKVPANLCTTTSMTKMKALIQSGKASSLEEAIRMMK